VWGPRKLKDLAKEKLQREIQVAGVSHCPVEDAAAALDLYKSHRPRWEACMSSEERQQQQYALQMAAARAAYESSMMAPNYITGTPFNFISALTPPSRSNSTAQNNDLSMSMHSYIRCGAEGAGSFENSIDGSNHLHHYVEIPVTSNTGLPPTFHHRGILDTNSYHSRMDSLDSRSFHGPANYPNRKHFHRSCSMTETPNTNHHLPQQPSTLQRNSIHVSSLQRQSSLEYAPPGLPRQSSLEYAPPGLQRQSSREYAPLVLQRQSSLEYAPPGLPSRSRYEYFPEVQAHISSCETALAPGRPPPGFDRY
jgi:hypothetical protein